MGDLIKRFVFLVNHASGSGDIFAAVGRSRAVLAFPGIAGTYEGDAVCYIDISRQHTVVEDSAADVVHLFQKAGFVVDRVRDMDAWLQRHAVFITSIAGALYEKNCRATRLFSQPPRVPPVRQPLGSATPTESAEASLR